MAKDIRMPKMANEWTVRPIRKGPDDDVQGPNLSARYPGFRFNIVANFPRGWPQIIGQEAEKPLGE